MKPNQMGFDLSSNEEKPTSQKPRVLSVSELNSMIRGQLESEYSEIWLQAEISNFIAHRSGHYYFQLKDDKAQVSAVMFRGMNSKLKFKPENGLEVMVRGKITVYEPRGNYQVFCQWMEPVGAGALQQAYEQLKAKLAAEGLFELDRKKPLPKFPKHIGVVTSPTGAAIRDILNVLKRRYKSAKVTLAPAVVQGDAAADSIVSAIELVNKVKDVDVLIVGRGGGSIEDLWCFNEEKVARAIANSRIPIISAVGHEVDFTISDFVADLRAPTPSAAAELVVQNASDLFDSVIGLQKRLAQAIQFKIRHAREALRSREKQLIDPRRRLQDLALRCDELSTRLEQSTLRFLDDCRRRVEFALTKMGSPKALISEKKQNVIALQKEVSRLMQMQLKDLQSELREKMAQLEALSPLKVVERGYSIVTDEKKKIIKDASKLKPKQILKLQFARGQAEAEVKSIIKN